MINININNYLQNTLNTRSSSTDTLTNSNIEIIKPSDVGVLDSDAFLKMMLTQLQNQDPLSPMDTNTLSTQMAQFTTVEQLTGINSKLDDISELIFMSLIPEVPSSDSSTTTETDKDTNNKNDDLSSSEDSETTSQESIIKNELENLKSITIKKDFDYTSNDIDNLKSKLSNLILRSN